MSFTPGALAVVHQRAGGVPRLINLICDRALLAGYVHGARVVDASMVRRAAREVRGVTTPEPLRRYAALAALTAAAAVAALGLWHGRSSSAPVDAAPAAVAPGADGPSAGTPATAPATMTPSSTGPTSIAASDVPRLSLRAFSSASDTMPPTLSA